MTWKMICAAAAAVLLTGCATDGPVTGDAGCLWTRPIYVGAGDHLTEETAVQIEAHNETGARRCGWRPRH